MIHVKSSCVGGIQSLHVGLPQEILRFAKILKEKSSNCWIIVLEALMVCASERTSNLCGDQDQIVCTWRGTRWICKSERVQFECQSSSKCTITSSRNKQRVCDHDQCQISGNFSLEWSKGSIASKPFKHENHVVSLPR